MVGFGKLDDAVRLGEGKRAEQHSVHDREYCGIRADPQRQRQNGDDGEPRTLRQHADRIAKVLPDGTHPVPPGVMLRRALLAFPRQVNCALGEICVTLIVRNHANGRTVAMQVAQQFHDCLAVFRIEVSGRLVSHQNQRITDQRASHGDALLLTAGELRGIVAQPVRHSHAFQRVLHLLLSLRCARAAIRQWQLHVFIHRQVADQIERLENKSNLAVADSRAFADRKIRHRRSVQRIVPARW